MKYNVGIINARHTDDWLLGIMCSVKDWLRVKHFDTSCIGFESVINEFG